MTPDELRKLSVLIQNAGLATANATAASQQAHSAAIDARNAAERALQVEKAINDIIRATEDATEAALLAESLASGSVIRAVGFVGNDLVFTKEDGTTISIATEKYKWDAIDSTITLTEPGNPALTSMVQDALGTHLSLTLPIDMSKWRSVAAEVSPLAENTNPSVNVEQDPTTGTKFTFGIPRSSSATHIGPTAPVDPYKKVWIDTDEVDLLSDLEAAELLLDEYVSSALSAKTAAQGYAAQLAAGLTSPGVYATFAALVAAKPTGDTKIYVVTSDGYWYYWNGSAWVAGGVYQAVKIAPDTVGKAEISANMRGDLYQFNPVAFTPKIGYYARENGNFYPNPSYESAYLPCKAGDMFSLTGYSYEIMNTPLLLFYDAGGVFMYGSEKKLGANYDYVLTIPIGVYFFSTTSRPDQGVPLKIKKLEVSDLLLNSKRLPKTHGKKCIVFGDSISAVPNRWRSRFYEKTGMSEIACYAVSGAWLRDYADTVLDGETFTGSGNTVCNQIQAMLNSPPEETPDVVIISAGSNDTASANELQASPGLPFVDGSNQYINIDSVDRTTFSGAMRWQAEKIYSIYPNAVIFFATPIQGAQSVRASWNIFLKSSHMRGVAEYMAIPVIDAGKRSRIYGRYETSGANGKYLSDGLHPNVAGGIVLGDYYASEVLNYMNA